jgi:hypothetical protein
MYRPLQATQLILTAYQQLGLLDTASTVIMRAMLQKAWILWAWRNYK